MDLSLVTVGLVGLVTFCLHYIYKKFISNPDSKYWGKYGVKQVDATVAVSNWDVFLGRKDLTERDVYAYDILTSSGEKCCGMIENSFKVLLVRDADLLKKILIKDFEYFPARRDIEWARDDNILNKMITSAKGEEWRNLRHTLSPAFTSGKIRKMMTSFNTVGKDWATSLKTKAKSTSTGSLEIDVVSCSNTYTVDVIAASVFGMKAGTIENPDSEFFKYAMRFMSFNYYKTLICVMFPKLAKFLGIEVFDMEAISYFEKILRQGLQKRLKGNERFNDFVQLLIDAKRGELKASVEDELGDFEKDAQLSGKTVKLTDEVLNAQSLLFFLAGFSTTANFVTFALYALGAHPDIQEKLRKELDEIVKGEGDFDYDDLAKVPYMDMCVNEVLRMFSPILRLERICAKDYTEPETGFFIPKGTLVAIPVKSLHYDKQYYPNPDNFDPEGNWSPKNKMDRSPYVFLPFGSGPRNCIGMRFAMIEGKAAVAHIVHNFVIEPTDKTPLPIRGTLAGIQMMPPKGLELRLIPRK